MNFLSAANKTKTVASVGGEDVGPPGWQLTTGKPQSTGGTTDDRDPIQVLEVIECSGVITFMGCLSKIWLAVIGMVVIIVAVVTVVVLFFVVWKIIKSRREAADNYKKKSTSRRRADNDKEPRQEEAAELRQEEYAVDAGEHYKLH